MNTSVDVNLASRGDPAPLPQYQRVSVHIPFRTLLKVLFASILCYCIYQILPFLMLIFMSVLLAVAFEPVTLRLEKKLGRLATVVLISAVIIGGVIATAIFIIPALAEQLVALFQKLPEFSDKLAKDFPPAGYYLKQIPEKLKSADASAVSPVLAHLASFGGVALGGLSSLALLFVFMVYLLFDGARVYAWALAFFKTPTREKIEATCDGVVPVISAYVLGQLITSVLVTIYTFVLLKVVGVPAALVLAVLAGIFDILPIIGFFLFAIPATIFSLTVSPQAALIVFFAFGCYHMLETYYISPMVYGKRLRVSGVVVLFSLVAGATIGGILGAIAILPIVASYPVIEEVWLKKFLGSRVIVEHKVIAEEEEGADAKTGVPIHT